MKIKINLRVPKISHANSASPTPSSTESKVMIKNKRKKPEPDCSNGDGKSGECNQGDKAMNDPDQAFRFCEEAMKQIGHEEYLNLMEWLHDYETGKITIVDVRIRIADYFPDLMDDFDRLLESYGHEDKKLTENYVLLPKDARGVYNKGATELVKEVINSLCVFCKGLSSDSPPKRFSPAEEMLNEREDELYTRDMLRKWCESAKRNARKLSNHIWSGIIQEPTMDHVNKYIKPYDFRFIEIMYGKDMVEEVRREPITTLPILIEMLDKVDVATIPTSLLDFFFMPKSDE